MQHSRTRNIAATLVVVVLAALGGLYLYTVRLRDKAICVRLDSTSVIIDGTPMKQSYYGCRVSASELESAFRAQFGSTLEGGLAPMDPDLPQLELRVLKPKGEQKQFLIIRSLGSSSSILEIGSRDGKLETFGEGLERWVRQFTKLLRDEHGLPGSDVLSAHLVVGPGQTVAPGFERPAVGGPPNPEP